MNTESYFSLNDIEIEYKSFYIDPTLKNKINKNLENIISKKFQNKKTKEDFISIAKNSITSNFYRYRLNQFRIYAQIFEVENGYAFIIIRKINKKENDDIFLKKSKDWLQNTPLSTQWVNSIKKEIRDKINKRKQKKLLQIKNEFKSYKEWLDIKGLKLEFHIFESREWIDGLKNRNKDKIFNICEKLVYNKNNIELLNNIKEYEIGTIPDSRNIYYIKERNDNLYIIYKIGKSKKANIIFFIDIISSLNDKEKIKNITTLYNNIDKMNDIQKNAFRAYPDWVFADFQLWENIVNDEISNLALSPEEENILNNLQFPLYINGHAGSGKSTLLYYIFAHFLYQKVKKDLKGEILFLTYSNKLLENSKRIVESIINNQPELYIDNKSDSVNFDNYFFTYKQLLLNINNEFTKFPNDKFVDFNKFKELYRTLCKLHEKKNITEEIAWFVIRTFIKGYKYDSYLTPTEFSNIRTNRGLEEWKVEDSVYKLIYNTIWKQWYKKLAEEQGYWDIQDLVRYILNKTDKGKIQLSLYPVVICDEAQDFTRNDILFIIKISIFSKFNKKLDNIPIILAGDPFQSINPSGFKWSFAKSTFYEIFNNEGINASEILKELKVNYRATATLCIFSNLVQYYRHKFLKANVKAQLPWRPDNRGFSPDAFYINELKKLLSQSKSITDFASLVIPDSSDDFIHNDEILKNSKEKFNIYSPTEIKGLEFANIIIYKFGDFFYEKFNSDILSVSKNIPLSYFFNNLYVAITRAKERIFIIDTEKGFKKFWNYFTEDNISKLFSEIGEMKEWIYSKKIDNVLKPYLTKEYEISEIIEKDKESIARKLETEGKMSQNSNWLRRASAYYKSLGFPSVKWELLLAEALEIEKDFKQAGMIYKKYNKVDSALKCFWYAKNWKEFVNIVNTYNDIKKSKILEFRKPIAEFMFYQGWLTEILDNKEYIIKYPYFEEEPFINFVNEIKKRFKKQVSFLDRKQKNKFGDLFLELGKKFNDPELYKLAALQFYENKRWMDIKDTMDEYIKLKGKSDILKSDWLIFYESLAHISSDRLEKINYFLKAEKVNDAINEWENLINSNEKKDLVIDEETATQISKIYLSNNQINKAFNHSYQIDLDTIFNQFFNSPKLNNKEMFLENIIKKAGFQRDLYFYNSILEQFDNAKKDQYNEIFLNEYLTSISQEEPDIDSVYDLVDSIFFSTSVFEFYYSKFKKFQEDSYINREELNNFIRILKRVNDKIKKEDEDILKKTLDIELTDYIEYIDKKGVVTVNYILKLDKVLNIIKKYLYKIDFKSKLLYKIIEYLSELNYDFQNLSYNNILQKFVWLIIYEKYWQSYFNEVIIAKVLEKLNFSYKLKQKFLRQQYEYHNTKTNQFEKIEWSKLKLEELNIKHKIDKKEKEKEKVKRKKVMLQIENEIFDLKKDLNSIAERISELESKLINRSENIIISGIDEKNITHNPEISIKKILLDKFIEITLYYKMDKIVLQNERLGSTISVHFNGTFNKSDARIENVKTTSTGKEIKLANTNITIKIYKYRKIEIQKGRNKKIVFEKKK